MLRWETVSSLPIGARHNAIVLASIFQPTEEGEPSGEPQIAWAHVAYPTSDGWQVGTGGFKGVHGFASFAVHAATHWMRLPEADEIKFS